ncbi:SDR family oxidoreductase [Calothrix sp. FACHB-1219]|uniref:SDR family oxidoreductase n=1 Tax=unclassified Calothrix TaxID=2619626 RepID=UPI001689875C|nr:MULTISPECIES: SDR family oxidoreductase [unclassified Calothrix]MBD2204126.1 SDR family oxidoreductase [Calothrix sp. FACHB-168]MBD2220940.1 SDR family oxidoreductase [Calothrix sp. FACHB-1219]
MQFIDKVVWITGASSGIGEALAYQFANQGAKLIISARREEELQRVKQNINSECLIITLDITDSTSLATAVQTAINHYQKIDILVNNAGISQRSLAVDTQEIVDRKIMEINYFGTINLTKKILPYMIARGSGQIAVVSSIVGAVGFPLRSAYAASKHALHGFFETLQLELKPDKNIFITIICPGRIKTNISYNALNYDGSAYQRMDEGQEKGMNADICAQKMLAAIYRKKREVYIGSFDILLIYFKRYIPTLFYWIASRVKPT